MKIVFFGDSITDAQRKRDELEYNAKYGSGFVIQVAGRLFLEDPTRFEIVNRGIGGDRIVDLIARIKKDVWNEQPDVLNILEGINDISHEVYLENGVDEVRWERLYRMLLQDTVERLPNTKIMICEPFVLKGRDANVGFDEHNKIRERSKILREIAKDFGACFVPLQATLDEAAAKFGDEVVCSDGMHPTVFGATLIAEEWLKAFRQYILDS